MRSRFSIVLPAEWRANFRSLICCAALAICCTEAPQASAAEITAEDLAAHLRVKAWATRVDLPPGTFSAAVMHVVDGRVINAVTEFRGTLGEPTGQHLAILLNEHPSGIQVTVKIGASYGGNRDSEQRPVILIDTRIGLPSNVREGDYVLGGEYVRRTEPRVDARNLADVKNGLVLRIEKEP